MVVHHKENSVAKNFEESKEKLDFVNQQDFKYMRLINNIFFGKEIKEQLPIACNFDFHKSIDFKKGCYLGQETSARQYFTGKVNARHSQKKTNIFHCI
jgi:folate-binding protein YgfZ